MFNLSKSLVNFAVDKMFVMCDNDINDERVIETTNSIIQTTSSTI